MRFMTQLFTMPNVFDIYCNYIEVIQQGMIIDYYPYIFDQNVQTTLYALIYFIVKKKVFNIVNLLLLQPLFCNRINGANKCDILYDLMQRRW